MLYGSEPPPVDSVWEKIREKGWRVESQHRSQVTGKEKKVDTKLVAEVTRTAITTPKDMRTTIVLVTGDADVVPALEEILKEDHWKIEIYMWKQALANELTKFASDHSDQVDIKPLDMYITEVTFTSMKFNISSNKALKSKVKESGVVFSMIPKAFGNRIPTKDWCNQLESITQWPFQYYWFEISKKKTDNLVVVFLGSTEGSKFDVANFIATIKTYEGKQKYHLPYVEKVQPFLQFIEKEFNERSDLALEQVGIYNQDDVFDGHENEKNYVSESSDKWSTVTIKGRRQRRQNYSEQCPYKFNCYYGTRCMSNHTPEEKQHFSQRKEGRGNPLRKVEMCKHFMKDAKCHKRNCEYAHGEKDAWCLTCRSNGHFTKECPSKKHFETQN